MSEPVLSKIRIYPIKSLDPIELMETEVGTFSLRHDREFAMVAADGRYVNGKRTGRVNQLKAEFELQDDRVRFVEREREDTGVIRDFDLREGNEELTRYLGEFFDSEVQLVRKQRGEMMDMPQVASVSIISTATLESLHEDMPEYSMDELRLRFRANLEIGGVEPHWEDRLFAHLDEGVQFTLGDVNMIGISPRARCSVPPRDPYTGETDRTFAKRMMASRSKHLPSDSTLTEHGNFYHLTVNTYVPESEVGKTVRVGDKVGISGPVKLEAQ